MTTREQGNQSLVYKFMAHASGAVAATLTVPVAIVSAAGTLVLHVAKAAGNAIMNILGSTGNFLAGVCTLDSGRILTGLIGVVNGVITLFTDLVMSAASAVTNLVALPVAAYKAALEVKTGVRDFSYEEGPAPRAQVPAAAPEAVPVAG